MSRYWFFMADREQFDGMTLGDHLAELADYGGTPDCWCGSDADGLTQAKREARETGEHLYIVDASLCRVVGEVNKLSTADDTTQVINLNTHSLPEIYDPVDIEIGDHQCELGILRYGPGVALIDWRMEKAWIGRWSEIRVLAAEEQLKEVS